MVDATLLTGMWIIAVLQLGLEAGIVLYAYRLTRLTGSFRAWTMIILAFVLTTASSIFGVFLLLVNPDLIASLVQSIRETFKSECFHVLTRESTVLY